MCAPPRSKSSFFLSILVLVGHLCCTTFVLVALFSLGWIVSCIFTYLGTIHRFPDEIFALATRLEVGLVYVDALFSGIVLLSGIVRFVKDVIGENR
jgi:hypothetical protein